MRQLAHIALAAACACAAYAMRAPEAWDDISIVGKVAYDSANVFRGMRQSNSAVEYTLEIGYPVYQGNIYTGFWGASPIAHSAGGNELDFYLGYAIPFGKYVRADIGHTYYDFPQGRTFSPAALYRGFCRSNETYVGIVYDTTEIFGDNALKPSLYYYYDWNCDKHTVEASLAYEWNLSPVLGAEGWTLSPEITLGAQTTCRPYGDTGAAAAIFEREGNVYYAARISLAYALNPHAKIYAFVHYAGQQNTAAGSGGSDTVGAGAGVAFGL